MTPIRLSRRTLVTGMAAAGAGLLGSAPAAGEERLSPWCVACSPDGTSLAAGAEDGSLRVWNLATRKLRRELRGHADAVFGVAFSPDGHLLVSCGRDAPRVRVWDLETGSLRRGIDAHPRWTWAARFSPDGRRIVTCGDDSIVRVWDPGTGEQLLALAGHRGTVKRVGWLADRGREPERPAGRIVSGGDDGLLRVWDGASGAELFALAGHTSWLESLACGPGGLVVTAGGDRSVRTWDVVAGRPLRTFSSQVADLACVALSPDGRAAVSGAADGSLRLWNAETGEQTVRRELKAGVLDLAFLPDGNRIAAACRDEGIRICAASDLAPQFRLPE